MISLILVLLPLISALPNPEPFAIPLHLTPSADSSSKISSRLTTRSPFALPLQHTTSHIHRSIDADLASRNIEPRFALDPNWLLREEAKIDTRYNEGNGGFASLLALPPNKKRAGGVTLINHNLDASYSGSISIGTPGQNFDVVLDTGSADLWVAGSSCNGCGGMNKFNEGASSSRVGTNNSFSIQYGSGSTSGHLIKDTVSMGGYSVASQTFAVCDQMSSGLISDSLSGIMGLSWAALSYSKAVPWWVNLVTSGAWSQPLFGFYLARYRDVAGASRLEYNGGTATFGYLDSSLYTGGVTYINVPNGAQYWQIPMDSATIQGTSITLNAGNSVAVDTGTTLIGGPASTVASIYAAIPGSRQMSGSYSNYYEYPCTTSITFQLVFGGFPIKITDRDFNLGRYGTDQTYCTGAVFIQNLPSGSPVQWIVGDTALKNVYSIYRYNPPAVGFANLPGSAGSGGGAGSGTSSSATVIPSGGTLDDTNPGIVASASISTISGTGIPSGSGVSLLLGSSSSGSGSKILSGSSSKTSTGGSVAVVTATQVVTAADVGGPTSNAAAAASTSKSAAWRGIQSVKLSWIGILALGSIGFSVL